MTLRSEISVGWGRYTERSSGIYDLYYVDTVRKPQDKPAIEKPRFRLFCWGFTQSRIGDTVRFCIVS